MIHFGAKYLFAACLLLAASAAHGQAALLVLIFGDKAATENFHFSIDAGLNVATLPGLDGGDARLGFNFGLGTYIRLNDNWAFTPEFKPLAPRGAKGLDKVLPDPGGVVNNTEASELRLNYIDVPLQVHRRINDRLYVRAGPQVSFLTGAVVRTTGDLGTGEVFTLEDDVKDDLESLDVSFPVDLGIVFAKPRGYKGVELRLRYTPGFMEVFKDTEFLSTTNSTFQFFLSLPFVNVEEDAATP
ncbi:MAG: PorT family protein [Flavobacteriales bacterium]|nr:PorT family protein [Flavobacteriales bacterium]